MEDPSLPPSIFKGNRTWGAGGRPPPPPLPPPVSGGQVTRGGSIVYPHPPPPVADGGLENWYTPIPLPPVYGERIASSPSGWERVGC